MKNNKKYTIVCYEFPYDKYEPKKFDLDPTSTIKEAVDAVHDFIQSDFEYEILQEGARRDHSKPQPFFLTSNYNDDFLHTNRQKYIFEDLFYPGALVITSTDVIEEGSDGILNPMDPIPLVSDFDIETTALRVFIIKNMDAAFLWPYKHED